MGRRPMCVLCLLLIAFLCLGDRMGMPLIRGNPLPDNLRAWIEKHPDSSVCGEVERCVDTEISQSVYLRDVYLIYNSKKVSIGNVRVFLKAKEELPVGSVILVSENWKRRPSHGIRASLTADSIMPADTFIIL